MEQNHKISLYISVITKDDDIYESLIARLTNAVQYRCYRTARARVRELAKYVSQQYTSKELQYDNVYNYFINKYNIPK